jgi:hypothetical protein
MANDTGQEKAEDGPDIRRGIVADKDRRRSLQVAIGFLDLTGSTSPLGHLHHHDPHLLDVALSLRDQDESLGLWWSAAGKTAEGLVGGALSDIASH